MLSSALGHYLGSSAGSVVKNPSANEGDMGSILSREDSLEKEMATHFSSLAWEIPWTERSLAGYKVEPGVAESDTT